MATTNDRWDKFCYGLRDLRAWLEDPEIRELIPTEPSVEARTYFAKGMQASWYFTPSDFTTPDHTGTEEDVKALFLKCARKFGKAEKLYGDSTFSLDIPISDYITAHIVCNRETVCTKRVLRTEHVEARVIPAHEHEVVEWDCHPLLKEHFLKCVKEEK